MSLLAGPCPLSKLFLATWLLVACVVVAVRSDEILGCGGFLKSHADIDFSKVEVKLLTKQGSLKDTTDCSPSNGYYFLPVYDRGDYVLKISPPPGWSFEPEQISVAFDGKTDVCSQGKDVNFVFKGFGITGRVEVQGQSTGAKGVTVELRSADHKDVRTTISDQTGVFYFTPVIPGKYSIKVSRDNWHFEQSKQTVVVSSGNTELPKNSFVVSGFNVRSNIKTDNGQTSQIEVLLYAVKGGETPTKCSSVNLPVSVQSNIAKFEGKASCSAKIDSNGNFVFNAIPTGKYLLRAVVAQKSSVRLHIQPEFVEIDVLKESVELRDSFEVTGFSIEGRVLTSANGKGVAGAKIKLNGKDVATTHTDGSYILSNIQSGSYAIQVSAENVQFTDRTVKISSAEPKLPDILVNTFKVCGIVLAQKSYTVALTTQDGNAASVLAKSKPGTGEWCTFLANGKYTAEMQYTDAEPGVEFFPAKQQLHVQNSPVSGILFSQLRATLSGQVKCLPGTDSECNEITVTLLALDANGKSTGKRFTANLQDNGKFSFTDVLPGLYDVTVPDLQLCWITKSHRIAIKTAEETVPVFEHSGYLVSVISSHATQMKLSLQSPTPSAANKHDLTLTPGLNTICVQSVGVYTIQVDGCHQYDTNELPRSINIAENAPITVNAIKHRTGIRVLSAVNVDRFELHAESKDWTETIELVKLPEKDVSGKFVYRHEFELKPEERVTLVPRSGEMLFAPERKEIVGQHDCVETIFTFEGVKALIVDGSITPAIGGANVRIIFPNNPELTPIETTSTAEGRFSFGPLDNHLVYNIEASKESYVFSEYDHSRQAFKAHKLCEIVATVKDEEGNSLPGVLLSLSGGESYRKNLVTGSDGTIKFHSLSPSQYYLRPMMKEYKFEPNSKMIDVKDGETIDVELNGKRVAFSVIGSVRTLNGEPFNAAVVETHAVEPCAQHQEEATTEPNGQYRIRGLQPGCDYTLRIKQGLNLNVERTIPIEKRVSIGQADLKDVDFVAITPIPFVDVTARIVASSNEHYKTLRIQLYRKGSSESPIYSQRVESPLNVKGRINPGIMVFFPRIPYDGKTYFVELTSSLSDKTYKYTIPAQSFISNRSSVFVEFEFTPEVRSLDGELNQNSISALILIAIIGVAFFKQELAFHFFNFLWSRFLVSVESALNNKSGGSRSPKKDQRSDGGFDENEIEKLAQSINATKRKTVRKA